MQIQTTNLSKFSSLQTGLGLALELRTGIEFCHVLKPDVLEGLALPKSAAEHLNL